ncbi:Cellulase (glycosyl hydrolase family 5) [Carpediemonas membranifera]|uniref:Cellulase (Glycosyl hydrolase family 5) n=1 Tax=Carpediemonas membranifera TaxID=201153 RepID=A0A8J6BB06_9EUKA|nr:Cellulase (glycosyl hydrolase family 5) [Carpediemonas membranifera]|eukprot:KAG9396974.1 Cellulase (glycosyl hydrolase family 5) [Carpediemonas membranifera]
MSGISAQEIANWRFVNVSSYNKNVPCDPIDGNEFPATYSEFRPFDNADPVAALKNIKELGFNGIRLMLFWECIEPQQNTYSKRYLDQVASFIELCEAHDVLVLIDFHQDLFSRRLAGSGAPDWALPPILRNAIDKKLLGPKGGYDHVMPCDKTWGGKYATDKCQEVVWEHWWSTSELRRAYINMTKSVVSHDGLMRENVIGVDIFNEPSFAELFHAHILAKPWLFKKVRTQLADFYSDAIQSLSGVVPSRVLFFIEPYGYDVSQMAWMTVGMAQLSVPDTLLQRTVYAAHIYQPIPKIWRAANRILRSHYIQANSLGVKAVWVGEFGDLTFNSGTPAAFKVIKQQTTLLEATGTGWAYYNYSPSTLVWNEEDMSVVTPAFEPKPCLAGLSRALDSRAGVTIAQLGATNPLCEVFREIPGVRVDPLMKSSDTLLVIPGDAGEALETAMMAIHTQGPAEELHALGKAARHPAFPLRHCIIVPTSFVDLDMTAQALFRRSFAGILHCHGCSVVSFRKLADAHSFGFKWGAKSANFRPFPYVDLSWVGNEGQETEAKSKTD